MSASSSSTRGAKRQRSSSGAKRMSRKSSSFAKLQMGGQVTREEKKNIDVNNSLTPGPGVATWTTPVLLNPCAQGDTANTRTGRQITLKSLYLRWDVGMNTTSIGGSPIRILVVYDQSANAAAPLITDILQTDNFNSPNNLGYNKRFMVLIDEITHSINANGPYSWAGISHRTLKNLPTQFNSSTTGTVADINSGSIYLLISQQGDIATAGPTLDYYSRIRFTDA